MEQANMVLSALQSMAAQNMVPKAGKADGKAADSFQKLLDQKAQSSAPKSDTPVEQKPNKADAIGKEEGPVQEDPLEQVKKLAEQGYALTQSNAGAVPFDPNNMALGQTETGEYFVMQVGEDGEVLSIIELDPWQQQQLQQLLHNMDLMAQAQDPKADAMLEATDPTVEHSPADLLETAVDEQAGEAVQQAVEEITPQQKDEDQTVELVDVDQGPQQLFHDVKAAPIKVGEAYTEQSVDEANVVNQVDTQLAQALQTGETMVRIQLTPENLGEVTVEITRSADGALRIALSAQNADTRGLLERHANDLQGMLSNRTQQDVEVNVQRQSESQQNQNQQHSYDGHNGHAQDGQDRRRQQHSHTAPEDFMQQLRLGLIPDGVEF